VFIFFAIKAKLQIFKFEFYHIKWRRCGPDGRAPGAGLVIERLRNFDSTPDAVAGCCVFRKFTLILLNYKPIYRVFQKERTDFELFSWTYYMHVRGIVWHFMPNFYEPINFSKKKPPDDWDTLLSGFQTRRNHRKIIKGSQGHRFCRIQCKAWLIGSLLVWRSR